MPQSVNLRHHAVAVHPVSSLPSMTIARRLRRVLTIAAGMLLQPAAALSAQRVLAVIARDTALEVSPTVPAGVTTVRLVLQGKARRELVVRRVPSGTPPETLIRGAAGRPTKWFAQWSFGGPAVPGDSATNASTTVELRPGIYLLVAYEVDASGRARGDRYLWKQFTAVAGSALIPGRFPVPDLTLKVRDARIDVEGTIRRGDRRTIQVENVGGQPHEIIIGRLKPGKTVDDVRVWTARRAESAPFVYVGGFTPMSPGVTAQTVLNLLPGEHVALFPMAPGPDTGADKSGVLTVFKVS